MASTFIGWDTRNGTQNGGSSSTSTSPEYSSRYNSKDAEVTYESSDHVRFRIHKIYLETHTGGLNPTEMGLEEVIHLTETSEALEALFDFIYPIPKAKVFARISSRSHFLAEAAEAAEKYQIFPAMNACFHIMRDTLPNAALPILAHALRHSYVSLANEAAPHLVDEAPANVTAAIPSEFIPTWLKYHQAWVDLQREILIHDVPVHKPDWDIVSQISGSLGCLKHVAAALEDSAQHNDWGKQIRRRIGQLPKLMDHTTQRTDAYGPFISDFTSTSDGDLVTLCSADKWEFSIRRDVLLKCALGFNDILPEPGEREVHLVEDELKVKILVGFLRPALSPYINWPHATINYFLSVAYVLEKYKVYYGMYLFKYFIQKRVKDHPSQVFVYAAKFGYHDILDEAAPLVATSQNQFTSVMHLVSMHMHSAWALYYQRWTEACFEAVKLITKEFCGHDGCQCGGCKKLRKAGGKSFFETFAAPAIKLLMEGPHTLTLLDSTLRHVNIPTSWPKCSTRESAIDAVKQGVQEYRDSIGDFSSFIEVSLAMNDVAGSERLGSDFSMDQNA